MKQAILGCVLVAGTAIFSGCGFVFVARNQPYSGYHRPAPGYCYDCHSGATYARYNSCGHYEIKVVDGGYYYRPLYHRHHEEFRYVKFSSSNYKTVRADQEKSERGRR